MERKKGVSIFIKAFVIFHVLGITIWALPLPRPAIRNGSIEPYGTDWILYYNWKYVRESPIKYYLVTAGVWQYWDMFAPNPASLDLWGNAEVEYQDGTKKAYSYYRIYDLPLPTKYFKERFRKFFERASAGEYSYLWPFFAQRVALEMDTMPDNPPAKVRLYKYTQKLKGPGQQIEPYLKEMYYEHKVDLPALRKAEAL